MKFSDPESNIRQMNVGQGMHVADFGSGSGFYSLALARKVGPIGKVFAIDINPTCVSKLKTEASHGGYAQIETVIGDLEAASGSGLISNSIDRVVISNMLFQSRHPLQIAMEAKRVLKRNGMVAVIDWSDSFKHTGPHPDHVLRAEEAKAIFEHAGFSLVSRLDAGSHHYGFLFKIPQATI